MATTTPPAPAPAEPQQQARTLPDEVYGVFCGAINQETAQKFVNALTIAMGGQVKHVHLLFQTAGGYVADGVFLYNFFRSIPIELTLYNVGQVSSIGVIAYLGARHRKVSKTATFMIHRSTNSSQFATATKLQHTAKSLVLDDQRTEDILRTHINLPPELWTTIEHHDLYFSSDDAIKLSMAEEIGDFAPPAGAHVFNLLA